MILIVGGTVFIFGCCPRLPLMFLSIVALRVAFFSRKRSVIDLIKYWNHALQLHVMLYFMRYSSDLALAFTVLIVVLEALDWANVFFLLESLYPC